MHWNIAASREASQHARPTRLQLSHSQTNQLKRQLLVLTFLYLHISVITVPVAWSNHTIVTKKASQQQASKQQTACKQTSNQIACKQTGSKQGINTLPGTAKHR